MRRSFMAYALGADCLSSQPRLVWLVNIRNTQKTTRLGSYLLQLIGLARTVIYKSHGSVGHVASPAAL
jgi:hypothetical protein